MKPKIINAILGATIILALAAALLFLFHANPDDRGVWTLTAPGLTLTALRDRATGPVLWLSTGPQFRGRWEQGQWHPAAPPSYPTATPYLTATPYPTSTPYPPRYRLPLRQA